MEAGSLKAPLQKEIRKWILFYFLIWIHSIQG